MLIHYHRNTAFGWQHITAREHDSAKWTPWQLDWIKEMLSQGSMCLTIGDSMFSLKKGD
jgi:hypothetical protein